MTDWRDDYGEVEVHPFDRLYCDFCERDGHTFRACPARDDDDMFDYD